MPITSKDNPELSRWQWRIFTGVWITYFSIYFCRVNIGAANKAISTDLGLDPVQIGFIIAMLKPAYGVGQFINGQLADRFGARKLLAVGLLCSAALNILFGFSSVYWLLLFLWVTNGYVQSMGWPSCVKIMANWFPPHLRGTAMGLVGTSYAFGGAAAVSLAGWLVKNYTWRHAFWVPAIYLIFITVIVLLMLRSRPQDAGLAPLNMPEPSNDGEGAPDAREAIRRAEAHDEPLTILETLRGVLTNRNLWIVAISFMCLDVIRYGFLDWGIRYLQETLTEGAFAASMRTAVMLIAGAVAMPFAGWATDHLFGARRAPVVSVMMAVLGLTTVFYHQIVNTRNDYLILLFLGIIGFTTYGPHVLMVGACPQDFGTRKMAASAAGFIDCMGYMGAMLAGVGTGYLLREFTNGWQIAIYVWAGAAFAAAILMALLWNVKVGRE